MALAQDPIVALVALFKADATISTLLGTRVFGAILPRAEADNQPRKAIVIRYAGGIGESSYRDISKYRLDIKYYGETEIEASKAFLTGKTILRDIEKQVVSSTFIYSAEHSAGPFPFTDNDGKWPNIIDTWLIKVQDTVVS